MKYICSSNRAKILSIFHNKNLPGYLFVSKYLTLSNMGTDAGADLTLQKMNNKNNVECPCEYLRLVMWSCAIPSQFWSDNIRVVAENQDSKRALITPFVRYLMYTDLCQSNWPIYDAQRQKHLSIEAWALSQRRNIKYIYMCTLCTFVRTATNKASTDILAFTKSVFETISSISQNPGLAVLHAPPPSSAIVAHFFLFTDWRVNPTLLSWTKVAVLACFGPINCYRRTLMMSTSSPLATMPI